MLLLRHSHQLSPCASKDHSHLNHLVVDLFLLVPSFLCRNTSSAIVVFDALHDLAQTVVCFNAGRLDAISHVLIDGSAAVLGPTPLFYPVLPRTNFPCSANCNASPLPLLSLNTGTSTPRSHPSPTPHRQLLRIPRSTGPITHALRSWPSNPSRRQKHARKMIDVTQQQ